MFVLYIIVDEPVCPNPRIQQSTGHGSVTIINWTEPEYIGDTVALVNIKLYYIG